MEKDIKATELKPTSKKSKKSKDLDIPVRIRINLIKDGKKITLKTIYL